MIKVGLISAWHVHAEEYANSVEESTVASICAVWDDDPARGAEFAKKHNAEFISDYSEFLNYPGMDAVICSSPTTMHPELLQKAINAKKHIFTEKLLATNSAQCEELCRQIDDAGIIFTISLPLTASSYMIYAKELVDSGALGKISAARFRRSHGGVSDKWLPDYWFDVSKTGGGALMDLGAHPVYVTSFLFGEAKRVSGFMNNPYGTSSDENAIALVEFENGVIATCETAFITYGTPDILEIYGTEGSLYIHGDNVKLVCRTKDENGNEITVPEKMPQCRPTPIMQFLNACAENKTTPEYLGTKEALRMTKIIEASYISNENFTTIKF